MTHSRFQISAAARAELPTEAINPETARLDQLSAVEFVALMQTADRAVLSAVEQAQADIAEAIARVTEAIAAGGSLTYIGAGTSGRLGVLDAAECLPTFQSEAIRAIMAGGEAALIRSVEGAEDDAAAGAAAVSHLQTPDVVMGISASGTASYVRSALDSARSRGLVTIFLACVTKTQVPMTCDVDIRVVTGPEVLAGSTRLKAGTATKLVLNTISTGVMVQLGKVYGNLMVDLAVTNAKLRERALRIIERVIKCDRDRSEQLLAAAHNQVKPALVMAAQGCDYPEAIARLEVQPLRALLA